MSSEYPLPDVDQINEPYWEAASEGRLALQACSECEDVVFPPRTRCPICFGELDWENTDGVGIVYTYGIVHRPNMPAVFEDQVPFVLAVVELEEGGRIVSNLVDCDPSEVEVGMEVSVVFDDVGGVTLPKFEPSSE